MNNKKVLEYCVNFDEIVNCEFLEDDILTKKLIEYYQEFVFNVDIKDKEQLELIRNLDSVMYKYIEDYRFAKKLKDTLDINTVTSSGFAYLEQLMQYLIKFMIEYDKEYTHHKVETRWI